MHAGPVPRTRRGWWMEEALAQDPGEPCPPLSADTAAGHLDWTITALKVREFPFPRSTIPAILRALGVPGLEGAAVTIPADPAVGDVRVSPARVRLYRAASR